MTRLLLLAPLVVLLSGCILYPGQHLGPTDQNVDNLMGARFAQQQAVPGFDTSSYTLDDANLREFRELMRAYDIDPDGYDSPDTDGCTGGITTRVQMQFAGNGDREMIIDGCGAEDGTFAADATRFFSRIREGEAPSTFSNAEIVSITFSQQQAVDGFDDGEYTQADPDEIARFVATLDSQTWSEPWVDADAAPDDPPCVDIRTDAKAEYINGQRVGQIIDGCRGPLSAAVTDLFSEWREALSAA
jgi:hypothetical protein